MALGSHGDVTRQCGSPECPLRKTRSCGSEYHGNIDYQPFKDPAPLFGIHRPLLGTIRAEGLLGARFLGVGGMFLRGMYRILGALALRLEMVATDTTSECHKPQLDHFSIHMGL